MTTHPKREYTPEEVADMVERLRAPAYWFTQGFDTHTGQWFSSSSAGHEGENNKPLEAADMLECLASQLAESKQIIDDGKRQWDQVAAILGADGDNVDDVLAKASQLAAQKWEGESVNPIDDLVDRFSDALRKKLHAAEAKYGYDHAFQRKDWRDACVEQLHLHLAKGDPRDVAAYCAFAWDHGWSLANQSPSPDQDREVSP